ncbi:MAG: HWE histidine kinase domain-containing protein [Brevundimonas sp.]|uniref:HWE histidine kinase domain-containing protein n=1 Tax=Brevundimonas sp. TaxID=1871086 RepID=UPI00391D7269
MTDSRTSSRDSDLEADNRRLRRLLDQRDAPGELRHRLQSTLAMLRIIIRKSAAAKTDMEAYVAHLEDRLDAIARAQAAADERGSVELHDMVSEELHHYEITEGERATISGPSVHFRPRAGQVLALAIHELAVNAIEHGALGAGAGQVQISWAVETGDANPVLTLVWKELGSGTSEDRPEGFGTEVLTRTLAYELRAASKLGFEPDGVRFTLRFPLTDRIGQIEPTGPVGRGEASPA